MAYSEIGNFIESANVGGTVIADELMESERGYARGPERSLLAALLFDGVIAFMNYAASDNLANKNKYKEAFNWVNRLQNDYIFSFDNVCEALGVDPTKLRLGLLNACHSRATEWRKQRRTF